MNFDADIACLIGHAVAKKFQTKTLLYQKIRALIHQSCREHEGYDGIISDGMSEDDFD